MTPPALGMAGRFGFNSPATSRAASIGPVVGSPDRRSDVAPDGVSCILRVPRMGSPGSTGRQPDQSSGACDEAAGHYDCDDAPRQPDRAADENRGPVPHDQAGGDTSERNTGKQSG